MARIMLVMAVIATAFAHSANTQAPTQNSTYSVDYAALYMLPDGTVASVCQSGDPNQSAAWSECEFCLISGSAGLPETRATGCAHPGIAAFAYHANGSQNAERKLYRLYAATRAPPRRS